MTVADTLVEIAVVGASNDIGARLLVRIKHNN